MCSALMLKAKVKGIGDGIVDKISKYLWSKQPPEEPTEEEAEEWRDWLEDKKQKVNSTIGHTLKNLNSALQGPMSSHVLPIPYTYI